MEISFMKFKNKYKEEIMNRIKNNKYIMHIKNSLINQMLMINKDLKI